LQRRASPQLAAASILHYWQNIGVWGAWRGFGLRVAVLCVLLRAYQIKRLCVWQNILLAQRFASILFYN
jgi:hypothetical protein